MKKWLIVMCVLLGFSVGAYAEEITGGYGVYPNCVAPAAPMESQSWWDEKSSPESFDNAASADPRLASKFRHIHIGLCAPNSRDIDGTVGPVVSGLHDFTAVVTMHNQPGFMNWLAGHAWDGAHDRVFVRNHPSLTWTEQSSKCTGGGDSCVLFDPPIGCATGTTCQFELPMRMQLKGDECLGLCELRFRPHLTDIEPRDDTQFTTLNPQVHYGGAGNYRITPDVIGRGWYTETDYATVTMRNYMDLFEGRTDISIPIVSGDITFHMHHTKGGGAVVRSKLFIDPNFHADDEGTVVYDVAGNFSGNTTIDTTTLTDGIHALVGMTQETGTHGDHYGLLKLFINVDNGSPPPADTDGDGITDDDETNIYGTNPNVADTDADGMDDGAELAFWNGYAGSDWNSDIDSDTVVNLLDADSDGDGLLDGSDPDPGVAEPTDTDGDGISDDDETNVYGTDPNVADTDADGLDDGAELAFWGAVWDDDIDGDTVVNLLDADSDGDGLLDGADPDPAVQEDTDGDGISDVDETGVYGTDPNVADTDADGLADGDELAFWNSHPTFGWDSDIDSDTLVNLLDPDSDGDGLLDGSDPDPAVFNSGMTVTVSPTDDTHVKLDKPTTNYGYQDWLWVREKSGDDKHVYMKFDLSGVASVSSATLRLYVTNDSPDGGTVYTAPSTWDEDAITWNTKPAADTGGPSAAIGNAPVNLWLEVDVTSLITAGQDNTLVLISNSTNSVFYSSTEGANPPELVVEQ